MTLKLPAYGKQLLLDRRAGKHPLEVALIYGDEWWHGKRPRICLKPAEYGPGKYDFRMVEGVNVLVHDLDIGINDCAPDKEPPTFGTFYDLLAELAAAGACVTVRWPRKLAWDDQWLTTIAWRCRWLDPSTRRRQWPRWWTTELHDKHMRSTTRWLQDCAGERAFIERARVRAV